MLTKAAFRLLDDQRFEEKERVYLEVMEKAWARQEKIIEQARKM